MADIIHIAGPVLKVLVICALLRRPFLVEHHGYQSSCPNGLLLYSLDDMVCPDRFMRQKYFYCLKCNAKGAGWVASAVKLFSMWPRRLLCRRARLNLCVSEHVQRRVALPRTQVVYHGVDVPVDNLRPSDLGSDSKCGGMLTVAFVGRLVGEKGVPVLVEAIRLIQTSGQRIALKIVGDGPERSRIEAAAATIDSPRVEFTGFLTGQALDDALKDVDVVAMPTVSEETAGIAVMEQMMRGRAVIVSNIGALPETAGEGGLTFPAGDSAALAEALRRMMDDRNLLRDLGVRGRARAVQFFNANRMVSDHLQYYRSVVYPQ